MARNSQSHQEDGSILGVFLALSAAIAAELILEGLPYDPTLFPAIARIATVFLGLYTLHRFARGALRHYRPRRRDIATISLSLMVSFVLIKLGSIVAISLSQYFGADDALHSISPETLYYAIPFASGALLIQSVLGLHFGLIFSVSLALIVGVYFPLEPLLIPFCLATCLVGCLSLSRFRSRSAYLRAGFNIGLIALPFSLASIVLVDGLSPEEMALRVLAALSGGVICTLFAAVFTPLVETLGGYVTDMRLLEMATLDHPLLKDLSIQAPGSWNHSMVIGMMVETAADAIGANPVLCRVGAYFHDIGKMKKPLYFVENQSGENPHDKLSTSMSALIIRSHVKDGIELAKQHRLPGAIIDMIPQHHGTSTIDYFYDKARKEAEEAGDDPKEIDISLYSYPGPKPQTREAGILLLADGIEAAARTISEPTPDRIQGLVQKLINKVFASGQLSECELTLQDLHHIAKSFTRVLSSIHHQRVAYSEPAEKINEKAAAKKEAEKSAKKKDPEKTPKKKDPAEKTENDEADLEGRAGADKPAPEEDKPEEDKKSRKEDLKRLGL